jgi:hypothetical protein
MQAAEITLPLTVRFALLTDELQQHLYTRPGKIASLWYESGCRYLYLDHPSFTRQNADIRFVSHGAGSAGTELLGKCLSPLSWRGFLEALVTPYVTADWQLHFHIRDSTLYDEEWHKGLITGPLWDAVEHFFLSDLQNFTVNLAPPQEEILSLVRLSVRPTDAAQVEAVLHSAVAKAVEVTEKGVVVQLALTVPEAVVQTPPPAAEPEAPLNAEELAAYHNALERWDAFLVFVIRGVGGDIIDPRIREDLLELLLTSRYALVPVLSGEITRGEGDPVRRVFIETWDRLREILQNAEQRGLVKDNILRYAAFISAGDALLALDQAAPGLGIEISADGLRRLARLLRPDATEDPLAYDTEVDPTLRTLFGLPAELESPSPPASPHSRLDLLGWTALAYAAPEEELTLAALQQRLDRWVPELSELAAYRPVVETLLRRITEQALDSTALEARYVLLYQTLVPATALKESCWRHFIKKGEEVAPVTSPTGSIGMMQVNPYIWRGFYSVSQLKQSPVYNTSAGAEILLRYFQKYGLEEGRRTGNLRNSARATYAVYNAGPKAVDRYRSKKRTARDKQIDTQFWEIYQGFTAKGEVDLAECRCQVQAQTGQEQPHVSG